AMKRITASVMALLVLCASGLLGGCAKEQAYFDSPDEAMNSLITALRSYDKKKMSEILGPEGDKVISSGDAVADRNGVESFLEQYDAKHSLVPDAEGRQTLVVGDEDWPMPIPLANEEGAGWYFDTDAGKDELINRRVGRNELSTIQVCLAIVDAQREYA